MPKPPKRFATIDCETDPFRAGRVPQPFLWDVYDGERHWTFEHVSDVLHFLSDKDWIVYAHNGGKFDYHMPGFLAELQPFAPLMVINGRLSKFKIGACEFRDSFNIFPLPLSAYKKDDIDYDLFEKHCRSQHMDVITRYLHGDTRYLFDMVAAFRGDHGSALTLAGAAMRNWQDTSGRDAPRSTAGFYARLQRYYYGGRVECFQAGRIVDPFWLVDINSAYPYAMLHQHPIGTTMRISQPDVRDAIIPQSLYTVAARSRGALPLRGKTALDFPDSDASTLYTATGWEVQAGLDTGTLKLDAVLERVDFAECVDFTNYVHRWYDIKKSAAKDTPQYIIAKLFMNSLYGKFGANPAEYERYTVCHPSMVNAAVADGHAFAGELGPWAVLSEPLDESQQRYYNVATAASITGFVRAYLWRHICAVRANGGLMLYCDTDSMAFQGDVPSSMAVGKELGQWGIEGDAHQFQRGAIGGKKLYAFQRADGKWKTSCKGARLSADEICSVCDGATVGYASIAPTFSYGKPPTFVKRQVRMTASAGN